MSNNIRVALFLHDIRENEEKNTRNRSMTVQNYSYTMTHKVDKGGLSESSESSISLSLNIRVGMKDDIREFYERIRQPFPEVFSLVFNPIYGPDGKMDDYEGATVVSGYIVRLDEISSRESSFSEPGQMSLTAGVLVGNMTCIGENGHEVSHNF